MTLSLKPRQSFDLLKWIEQNPQVHYKRPTPKPAQTLPQPNRSRDAYSQAQAYAARFKPAIEGQKGYKQTFALCAALIKGFCLTITEAKSLLISWNYSCIPPWKDEDLDKILLSAESAPDLEAKGYLLAKKHDKLSNVNFDNADEIEESKKLSEEQVKYEHSGILDDPASLAIRFMEYHRTLNGLCRYRWLKGQFYRWTGTHYNPLKDKKINARIFSYIEDLFLKEYKLKCSQVPSPDEIEKVKKKKVNGNLVENVKTGLIDLISISEDDDEEFSEPFWLDTTLESWNPNDVIPSKNKLIHLPSFTKNITPAIISKNPSYFSTFSLEYDFPYHYYDGPVEPPPIFKHTLDTIWPDDEESQLCLQEFYGYFLTPDTSLQKILMFIGPKRSGKGTMIRVAKHMLGSRNVCFPTFKSLTSSFGKQSLIGKTLAVFPDARITGRTDTGDIVETLLAISGEDSQTINRKYLTDLSTKLNTRFLIASNELPRLTENSGALVSRAIVLKFNETFIDNEDIELEAKLIPEIPGILRWAIDGWVRLWARKKFLQPASGEQTIREFLNISSPINHFILDVVDSGPEHTSSCKRLFEQWREWCGWNGRENTGAMDTFIRNLQSAIPKVEMSKDPVSYNGDKAAWDRIIKGARIKPVLDTHHESGIRAMSEEELLTYGVQTEKMREGLGI
jgi:putative DNA primase/helicase